MRAAVNSAGMASEGILWGAECKTVNCSSNFLKWGNDFAHNEAKDGLCSTSGTQPYDFEDVSTAEFCGGVPRLWHEVTNSEAEDVTDVNSFAVDRLEVYVYRHVNDASDLNKRRRLRRRAQIVSPAAKAPWPVAKAPSTGRARICPSCEMPCAPGAPMLPALWSPAPFADHVITLKLACCGIVCFSPSSSGLCLGPFLPELLHTACPRGSHTRPKRRQGIETGLPHCRGR